MYLPKELDAWSSRPQQAVLSAGEEARAPLQHYSEPAEPREEGSQSTASRGSGGNLSKSDPGETGRKEPAALKP